ncbi:hypothetical protein PEBR_30202 [Penicillium brasilianum]|uniref:Uncharacterized protein n=1 Tax=Penicillium brasilianum TaxID=104259 RepID=A0A1S9RG13_PENBI|nr:hypothetical protein PEBR_30202 [Penicillium brasilianum]
MLETIKSWFQSTQEPVAENKWDANTVTMRQPNCPTAPAMSQTVSEQPGSPDSMGVHMRGGDMGEGICCGLINNDWAKIDIIQHGSRNTTRSHDMLPILALQGYMWTGSDYKLLRLTVGRHSLPFDYDEEVELECSFLSASLKDTDYARWKTGKVPLVNICLRKDDVGFSYPEGEKSFARRKELEWLFARTRYTKFFLIPGLGLGKHLQVIKPAESSILSYDAGDSSLCLSTTREFGSGSLFDTTAFTVAGMEVAYTGLSGDAVPTTKGWLRTSVQKVNRESPNHRLYLLRRESRFIDVQPIQNAVVYERIELWPINVVDKGGCSVLRVWSMETEPGGGLFKHKYAVDWHENHLLLPVTP